MQRALKEAMTWLARQPRTLFVGQGVEAGGTKQSDSLADVPGNLRLEFPVAENLQLGFCTGLSLEGWIPISLFPRWNFLLLAADQLVNHLDRIPLYSGYRPKVIVRVAVGGNKPLDPGFQHQDDFTGAFKLMLKTIDVVRLTKPDEVLPAYQAAYRSEKSTILVE